MNNKSKCSSRYNQTSRLDLIISRISFTYKFNGFDDTNMMKPQNDYNASPSESCIIS